MSTISGDQIRKLREFLEETFSAVQLERFLIEGGYPEITHQIDKSQGVAQYAFDVIIQLKQYNRIDHTFFQRLREARRSWRSGSAPWSDRSSAHSKRSRPPGTWTRSSSRN